MMHEGAPPPTGGAPAPLELDGSQGEGGGQILRSALTLSLLTGTPFRLVRIRARRANPGLAAQHLAAVRAAAAVGRARVAGALLHSQELRFEPRGLHPGRHHVAVGTAGATSLVLQTVLPALARAGAPSEVVAEGGTHVRWSPSFDYLARHWAPTLAPAGLRASFALERAGFHPRGGGLVRVRVEPTQALRPLVLEERGPLREVVGVSISSRVPAHVAERQRRRAAARLAPRGVPVEIAIAHPSAPSPGSALLLVARCQHYAVAGSGLGERGKPAERVADEAVDEIEDALCAPAGVDAHLADQLVVPLAVARGRSRVATARVTQHLLTNAAVTRAFLGPCLEVAGAVGEPGHVVIDGRADAVRAAPSGE